MFSFFLANSSLLASCFEEDVRPHSIRSPAACPGDERPLAPEGADVHADGAPSDLSPQPRLTRSVSFKTLRLSVSLPSSAAMSLEQRQVQLAARLEEHVEQRQDEQRQTAVGSDEQPRHMTELPLTEICCTGASQGRPQPFWTSGHKVLRRYVFIFDHFCGYSLDQTWGGQSIYIYIYIFQ